MDSEYKNTEYTLSRNPDRFCRQSDELQTI